MTAKASKKQGGASVERPQRRTQGERRADAERRLLESAVELLAEKGVAGTTLSEVGERAGYSRGLVAHHYGNKENFLRAVANHIRVNFRSKLPAGSLQGLDTLMESVNLFYSGKAGTFAAMQALLAEAIMNDGPLREDMQVFTRETIDMLSGNIRRGVELGQIRADVDPDAAACLILGQLRGIGSMSLLGGMTREMVGRLRKEAQASLRQMLQA